MNRFELSIPECYLESSDFRFFLKWVTEALYKLKYDLDAFFDLYDPLRCPKELLWLLADTMGFKFDDRLPVAYNRLILLYFMSMIRYKGSRSGVLLAANVNLTQFDVIDYQAETKDVIDLDRLNFTNIRVNSAYVNVNSGAGYIDVVYFSTEKPIDACIEYVRPIGMYCFQHAGVVQNARTKLAIDVRLTDEEDMTLRGVTATQVGRYTRDDYATIQKAGVHIDRGLNLINPDMTQWSKLAIVGVSTEWTYNATTNTTHHKIVRQSKNNQSSQIYSGFAVNANTDYCLSFDFNWLKSQTNTEPPEQIYDDLAIYVTHTNKYSLGATNRVITKYVFSREQLNLGTNYKISLPFNSGNHSMIYVTVQYGGTTTEPYMDDIGTYEFNWGNVDCRQVPSIDTIPTGARELAYKRNSVYEGVKTQNAGYRSLYSLQLSNNQNINNLLRLNPPIFKLGYFPQDYAELSEAEIQVINAQGYQGHAQPEWNLLYDRLSEAELGVDVGTIDSSRTSNRTHPRPAVNPIMTQIGDAISMNDQNSEYLNRTKKSDTAVKDDLTPSNS